MTSGNAYDIKTKLTSNTYLKLLERRNNDEK